MAARHIGERTHGRGIVIDRQIWDEDGMGTLCRMRNWQWLAGVCVICAAMLSGCQKTNQPTASKSVLVGSGAATPLSERFAASAAAPGFDYYLLTLSWSPEYCHGHRNSPQCDGSHPGFVVHGLWPQRDSGQWPSDCSTAPGLTDPSSMLDIMPDPRLIAHEWATHGTCSGLSANQYFALIRHAYDSIKIPAALTHPAPTTTQSASGIKQMFVDANPGMSAGDIAISCHNRYLSAVEFCLSKSLQPIACQAVRDCNAGAIRIPAMQ